MFDRTRSLLFGILLIACLWLINNRNHTSTTPFYSFEEFTDDMSRVHYDMAHAAYARHDIDTAINACTIALKNKPDFTQAYLLLDHCYEQKKEIRRFLTTYHTLVTDYCQTVAKKINVIELLETISQELVQTVFDPLLCNVCDAATTLMRNNFVDTVNKLHRHVSSTLEQPRLPSLWQNLQPNHIVTMSTGERMYNQTFNQCLGKGSPALHDTITNVTAPSLTLTHHMA